MSDFLQFVDRVPTLPNRKKLTFDDSSVKFAKVEWADEPIEEGTFLNKANFNKLNAVLGYNEVTGQWNSTTSTAEFETELDLTEYKNNQRFLLQCNNKVLAPADDYNVVKEATKIEGSYLMFQKFLEMSNGNVLAVGANYSGGNYYGYFTILDQQGNIIKSNTALSSIFTNSQFIEMSNGNIMLVGYSGGGISEIILNQQGTIVKNATTILNNSLNNAQLIEMSNGNIFVIGSYNNFGYFTILDNQGNVVKSQTRIGNSTYMDSPQLIEMSNGNIMIVGCSGNSGCAHIYNNTGTSVSNDIYYDGNMAFPQLIELSNGNIMIVGCNNNDSNGYRVVLDQQGNIIKNGGYIGTYFYKPKILRMDNNNILIVGYQNSGAYNGYALIMSSDGSTNVKNSFSIESHNESFDILKMSNGNIMIVNTYNRIGYIMILDQQGNILKSKTAINTTFSGISLIELENNNVLVGGYYNSDGYIFICEPITTNASATINNVALDTLLQKDKYYELVYNEVQDKFICEEVRNAN